MLIKDIALMVTTEVLSRLAKTVRLEIPEEMKEYIEQSHLYHFTQSSEIADKIVQSEYLKPATGFGKNFLKSYGTAVACMFAGAPNVENYIKNLTDSDIGQNPYVNPTMIANAVEIDVKKSELKNYKLRGFADNAILCEGYCILPNERVRAVQMVPDLIRDHEGNPILDNKTGEPVGVNFRKRTAEEMRKSPDKYIASKDYLDYMNTKKLEYGYKDGKNILQNGQNLLKTIKQEYDIERKSTIENVRENFVNTIKSMFQKVTQLKIDDNTDAKIDRLLNEFTFHKKNPYRDEKFGLAVAKFQTEGLTQLDLKTELESLAKSQEGRFLETKRFHWIRDRFENMEFMELDITTELLCILC